MKLCLGTRNMCPSTYERSNGETLGRIDPTAHQKSDQLPIVLLIELQHRCGHVGGVWLARGMMVVRQKEKLIPESPEADGHYTIS